MAYRDETPNAYAAKSSGYRTSDTSYGTELKQHFNALEHTQQVLNASQVLSNRVQNVVSRLMGPRPESDEGAINGIDRLGVFPALHQASEDASYAIRRANEALDLLEKELA